MSDVARSVRVVGRVQGVFYRDSCARRAAELGVRGWVRNDLDGTVSGHLEGAAEAVSSLVAWCREGSPRAQVERVDVTDADVEGCTGFRIE